MNRRNVRGIVVLGPPVAWLIAHQACLTLQAADRERLLHGAESGLIVQDPGGGFTESHQPLDARRRRSITALP